MNIEERDLLIHLKVYHNLILLNRTLSLVYKLSTCWLKIKKFFSLMERQVRRMLQSNAVSINKLKVAADKVLCLDDLIKGKYILVQKGKKNYFLLKVV